MTYEQDSSTNQNQLYNKLVWGIAHRRACDDLFTSLTESDSIGLKKMKRLQWEKWSDRFRISWSQIGRKLLRCYGPRTHLQKDRPKERSYTGITDLLTFYGIGDGCCWVLDISEFMTRTHYVYLCIRTAAYGLICVCMCVCVCDMKMYGPEKSPHFKRSVRFQFVMALKVTGAFSGDEAQSI